MNKADVAAMVAEILRELESPQDVPTEPQTPKETFENPDKFRVLREKTTARLAVGRAGPRYPTASQLQFRADHAAAQAAVFSQVPESFARENGMAEVTTRCRSKEEYLTRPDLGRCFDEATAEKLRSLLPQKPKVQIVVGDGLSAAAITNNAMDCLAALKDALALRGIDPGTPVFVRYCRVGAGDAIGDITGCQVVCVLVGERPGLMTDKSMSAYLTYHPHTGVSESARTVVSNIHSRGTPAMEAGGHIGELIATILQRQVSGVGLHLGSPA